MNNRAEKKQGRRAAQMAKVDAREQGEANHYWGEVAKFQRQRSSGGQGKPPAAEVAAVEAKLFGTQGSAGINFDQYDLIPVERSDAAAMMAAPLDCGFSKLSHLYPPFLADNILKMRYDRPTPIQKHAVPLALGGHDLMCCAQTGSGKTCAFLLPVVVKLSAVGVGSQSHTAGAMRAGTASPQALVLAPTRELASQIELEAEKLCCWSQLKCVCVYGGAAAKGQLTQMAQGCHILVATPGRLTDFLNRDLVSLSAIQFLVLDEADRMLDMGFEPQIRRIVQKTDMPPKVMIVVRQLLCF